MGAAERPGTDFSCLHVNTHLDTRLAGEIGLKQTEVVVGKIKALAAAHKVPVVLTGCFSYDDLNPDATWTKYRDYLVGRTSYAGAISGLADARYELPLAPGATHPGTVCGHRGSNNPTIRTTWDRVCFMDDVSSDTSVDSFLKKANLPTYRCTVRSADVIGAFTRDDESLHARDIGDHAPLPAEPTVVYTSKSTP